MIEKSEITSRWHREKHRKSRFTLAIFHEWDDSNTSRRSKLKYTLTPFLSKQENSHHVFLHLILCLTEKAFLAKNSPTSIPNFYNLRHRNTALLLIFPLIMSPFCNLHILICSFVILKDSFWFWYSRLLHTIIIVSKYSN